MHLTTLVESGSFLSRRGVESMFVSMHWHLQRIRNLDLSVNVDLTWVHSELIC